MKERKNYPYRFRLYSLFDNPEQASDELESYRLDERELEDLRYLGSREFYRLHNVEP